MGTDKAALPVDGLPMVERVLAALHACDERITVGGPDRALEGIRHVDDARPGEGPLGAVLTAFEATDAEMLLVAACDLPWFDAAAVDGLLGVAAAHTADLVVPVIDDRAQWLASVWRRSAYPRVSRRYDSGVRSIFRGIVDLDVVRVDVDRAHPFLDVDTPEQYQSVVLDHKDQ